MSVINPPYEYKATVVRWIDGDTVDLNVDLGFKITMAERFRLEGVDTPERGQPNHDEAWNFAKRLAPEGSQVLIQTSRPDKYGRWLANVTVGGATVNRALLDMGLAKLYFGGTKDAG